ncbi:hypothetical protein SRHO_G00225300 [Serrasalmus rhombeus]
MFKPVGRERISNSSRTLRLYQTLRLICPVRLRTGELVKDPHERVPKRPSRKAEIRDVLLATLRGDGRLPVSPDSRSPTRAQSAVSVGVVGADTGLTGLTR